MYVLYQGTIFNQSGWLIFSISYFIFLLDNIIHNIPTWCNIAFNTNLVIISSNVEFIKYKPVYFLQCIHLVDMASTSYLSPFKRNWNMKKNLNNEEIIPLSGIRIFAVCSIMSRKGNHCIVYFIEVGQYKFLSWRSIYFLSKGLNTLASFFSYSAASILSLHSWRNDWYLSTMVQYMNWRC